MVRCGETRQSGPGVCYKEYQTGKYTFIRVIVTGYTGRTRRRKILKKHCLFRSDSGRFVMTGIDGGVVREAEELMPDAFCQ